MSEPTTPPNTRPIDPKQRAKLDQIFMSVVMDTQAHVKQSQPTTSGNLAAMFHRENMSDALQGCAMLIAGWNKGEIDLVGLERTNKALRALELPELAERVAKLEHIAEQAPNEGC